MTARLPLTTESSLSQRSQEPAVPAFSSLNSPRQPMRLRWGLAAAAALIGAQLLAMGMLARSQVEQAARRDAVRMALRAALVQCVEVGTRSTLDACVLRARQDNRLAYALRPGAAPRGMPRDADRAEQATGLMAVSLAGGN
jgi:hypothetical protein